MSYLLLLKTELATARFLNVISEKEKETMFIPENCYLVKEGEVSSQNIMKLPFVHDGIMPLFFDLEEAPIKYVIDYSESNIIPSIILLVIGFCKRSEKCPNDFHMMKCIALQERLEHLHVELEKHTKKLKVFTKEESKRENPFILEQDILEKIINLKKSKDRIASSVNDIKNTLGKVEQAVLHDF